MLEITSLYKIQTNVYDNKDLFTSKDWLDVLKKTYGFNFFYAYNSRRNINNGIIFAKINDLLGKRIVSLPFSDYIDVSHINTEDFIKMVLELRNKFIDVPLILKTNYNNNSLLENNIREAFYHVVYTLSQSKEEIYSKYSSNFKRNLRKANKSDIEILVDDSFEGVVEFYKLYSTLRLKKFASIPQPFIFFKNIFEIFNMHGKGFVLKAIYKKTTIAVLFVLVKNQTLYYKFGASDKKFLHLRPNNLLFDFLFRFAVKKGYEKVNLGLTGASDSYKGLLRFKDSMGAERKKINYFRINPAEYNSCQEKINKNFLKKITKVIVFSENIDLKLIDKFSEIIYPNFA